MNKLVLDGFRSLDYDSYRKVFQGEAGGRDQCDQISAAHELSGSEEHFIQKCSFHSLCLAARPGLSLHDAREWRQDDETLLK